MRWKLQIEGDLAILLASLFKHALGGGERAGKGLKLTSQVLAVDRTQNPKSGPGHIDAIRPKFSPL